MDHLYKAYEMLDKELKACTDKGKISSKDDLDVIDKLAHAMKSLKTTIAMCEAEDDGYSGRRGRDSMGRYTSRAHYDNGRSYDGRAYDRGYAMEAEYANDGYSREAKDTAIEKMKQELNEMQRRMSTM